MDAGTGEMYAMVRKDLTLSLRLFTDSTYYRTVNHFASVTSQQVRNKFDVVFEYWKEVAWTKHLL